MPTTLTRVPTGESVTLRLVERVAYAVDVPTVVHRVIGRSTADFTVHPAGPRAGTFNLLCANETEAATLYNLLRASGPFTLADTATNVADCRFLVTGRLGLELDSQTNRVCTVTVDYTETT